MNKEIEEKYNSYPQEIRDKMLQLRSLILEVASSDKSIDYIGESLKWSQLSFMTKSSGSTLRIGWSSKSPQSLSLFVNCQTKLISIFKELFVDSFDYIGNREVKISLSYDFKCPKLRKCIELCLKYHLIKNSF